MDSRRRPFFFLHAAMRLIFGAGTVFVAVYGISQRWTMPQVGPVSSLSYFTTQSNIFAGVVLIVAVLLSLGLLSHNGLSKVIDYFRGAATLYLVVTGLVFQILLAEAASKSDILIPVVNVVHHQILPIVLVLDWILDPPKAPMVFRRALWWLVFPAAYLAYSFVRGVLTGSFPYPFLDPHSPGGLPYVALMTTILMLLFVAVTWAVVRSGNYVRARRPVQTPSRQMEGVPICTSLHTKF